MFFVYSFEDDGRLHVSTMFPGLPLQYSLDGGVLWNDAAVYPADVRVPPDTEVVLIAR